MDSGSSSNKSPDSTNFLSLKVFISKDGDTKCFSFLLQKSGFFLYTNKPIEPENPTVIQIRATETWVENDSLCKNYILNGLSDNLCDYYSNSKSAKELWDVL